MWHRRRRAIGEASAAFTVPAPELARGPTRPSQGSPNTPRPVGALALCSLDPDSKLVPLLVFWILGGPASHSEVLCWSRRSPVSLPPRPLPKWDQNGAALAPAPSIASCPHRAQLLLSNSRMLCPPHRAPLPRCFSLEWGQGIPIAPLGHSRSPSYP